MLRRGPGIARVAVGTAVMAGTAGAVHHHQEQKYANQAAEQQQQAYAQQQAYEQQQAAMAPPPAPVAPAPAPVAAAPAAPSMDEKMAQLEKLGQLHNSGILTDEEFAAQKAAILNS
jgi:hypothetical protein